MSGLTPDPGSIHPRGKALVPDAGSVRPRGTNPTTSTPVSQNVEDASVATGLSAINPTLGGIFNALPGPVKPLLEKTARLAGTGVNKTFEVLNRASEANEARIVRGPGAGLHTLLHSETPEQYQADTAELARRQTGLSINPLSLVNPLLSNEGPFGSNIPGTIQLRAPLTKEEYDKLPGIERNALEFFTSMEKDPTTYAGGSGVLKELFAKYGIKSFPMVAKYVDALQRSDNASLRGLGNTLRNTYGFLNYKGDVALDLARKSGEQGIHQFRGIKAIGHAMRYQKEDLGNELVRMYRSTVKGLKNPEKAELYEAIHSGTVADLPEKLQKRAYTFKRVTDTLAHLEGDEGLRKQLANGGPGEVLHRYQKTSGNPEFNEQRGGAFFFKGPKSQDTSLFEGNSKYGIGGENTVEALHNPKNPLRITIKDASHANADPSTFALEYLIGKDKLDKVNKALEELDNDKAWSISGLPGKAPDMFKGPAFPDNTLVRDRISSELAKKAGHDAIEFSYNLEGKPVTEVFSFTPSRSRTPFQLPTNMQRFESEEPRNLQGVAQYNPSYVPVKGEPLEKETIVPQGEAKDILSVNEPMRSEERDLQGAGSLDELAHSLFGKKEEPSINTMKLEDPNLRKRTGDFGMLPPKMQQRIIEARLRGGAAAISAHDAEKELSKLFGKKSFAHIPPEAKEYFRQTYKTPAERSWWGRIIKGTVDIPKHLLFALPFRHMFNIGSLSFLADPSIANVTGAVGLYARMMVSALNPEEWQRILHDSEMSKFGKVRALISAPSGAMRHKLLGESTKYGVAHVPSLDRASASGWLGHLPLVGDIYKLSNRALWTFDDALKATRFNRLLKEYMRSGMDHTAAAYRAAEDVGGELINYPERSGLVDALSYIFPFAAYRIKAPQAIAKLVREHPERVLAAGRISPALVGDIQDAKSKNKQGVEQGVKSYLPLAETLRGVNSQAGIGDWLRSAAGWPTDMAASIAGDTFASMSGDSDPYIQDAPTYGKTPDWKYALNQIAGSAPVVGNLALTKAGLNEFQNQGNWSNAFSNITGFGKVSGPSPEQINAAKVIQLYQGHIDALNRAGHKELAKRWEKALAKYTKKHWTYPQ